MCYKAPGPRCSRHARKVLKAAQRAYKRNPTSGNKERLLKAQMDYESTPAGLAELHAKAQSDFRYYDVFDAARARRQEALRAYRESGGRLKSHDYARAALNSDLVYEGEKPKWWEKYSKEYPEPPELMDVLHTDEHDLAVIWEPYSIRKQDALSKGMYIRRVVMKDFKTGDDVGYITLCTLTDESFAKNFTDDPILAPVLHLCETTGKGYIDTEKKAYLADPSDENRLALKKRLWQALQPWKSVPDPVPDSEEELDAFLQPLAKRSEANVAAFKAFYKQTFVDFSRIEEPYQGEGLGTVAYIYTARALGKRGEVLKASGLQSDDAQRLWAGLSKKFGGSIGEITLEDPYGRKGQAQTYPILDLRDTAKASD